jgi:hypothetical protein
MTIQRSGVTLSFRGCRPSVGDTILVGGYNGWSPHAALMGASDAWRTSRIWLEAGRQSTVPSRVDSPASAARPLN